MINNKPFNKFNLVENFLAKQNNYLNRVSDMDSSCYVNVALFTPEQVYAIEKHWFDEGHSSFGLMQQAAWQIAYWIYHNPSETVYFHQGGSTANTQTSNPNYSLNNSFCNSYCKRWINTQSAQGLRVYVWVGSGNNGGDGWLVANYLKQYGAQVTVIEVAKPKSTDAKLAKQTAQQQGVEVVDFREFKTLQTPVTAALFIDALFGIGLDRMPENEYAEAIEYINTLKRNNKSSGLKVISIDIPSGLVAGTGQVFNSVAVKADVTLCLVARKLGLHLKDAADYTGSIIDIALIPSVFSKSPVAWLQHLANALPARENNSHKGSFGHALIVGGNQIDGSQGMGGAAILSASTAFATGVGKLTVACHKTFHASLITSLPHAMTLDLHDVEGVKTLIEECDTLAIGMGLGRDDKSKQLFETYLELAIENGLDMVIDADGLYHLATLHQNQSQLVNRLREYATQPVMTEATTDATTLASSEAITPVTKPATKKPSNPKVWFTPHSGEAARLLNKKVEDIEANRLASITQLVEMFGGSWLLKGAGSIVKENDQVFVCGAGNAGMATAGMGDVLSGLSVGLLAQPALPEDCRSLQQAVMIHALAGDMLAEEVGVWALQASEMPNAVGQVLNRITV